MYYICKFSDTWSVYDANKQSSRNLEPAEVNCIKSLFPGLVDDTRILTALQVNSINPNKLLQLPTTGVQDSAKKVSGKSDLKGLQEKTA